METSTYLSQVCCQGLRIFQIRARWFLSRLLPTSRVSWKLSPKFQGNPSDFRQTDGYHTFRRWFELLHGTRDAAASQDRGRRIGRIKSSTECKKKQRNVRRQAGSRPPSFIWKNVLAGWPPSKSVGLRPFQRRAVRPLRCWEVWLLRESQAAQRHTRLALCLEPVQASVAPVRTSRQLARSHQRAMRLPANLSTLPKNLQSWLQFWTNPGAHNHWRKSSDWIWVGQQRKRSTCTPITNTPEFSLRRTGRRCKKI